MNKKNALILLNRLSNRRPGQTVRLEEALRSRLDELAEAAVEVAVETGDPIGQVLAGIVPNGRIAPATIEKVLDHLSNEEYRNSVPLRELGLAVAHIALRHWQNSEAATEEQRIQRLNDLGFWLRGLGDPESAVHVVEEALALSRKSATGNPRNTARNLHSLAALLADLEHREEALAVMKEALEMDRCLAASDPDHQLELVSSLQNLGTMYWSLSRFKEALMCTEEAVERSREIAPDPRGHGLSLLANGSSQSWGHLGRPWRTRAGP